MKWTRGRATVDQLLAGGRLEEVTGAAADGTTWLVSAEALLESAKRESARNPEAAYVLAYDAARKASTALVVQQGLRPKSAGHHVTVEQVVRAEIEYPQHPGDDIEQSEAEAAIGAAAQIHAAAVQLLPQLEMYR
jgi:hypothetical protein